MHYILIILVCEFVNQIIIYDQGLLVIHALFKMIRAF